MSEKNDQFLPHLNLPRSNIENPRRKAPGWPRPPKRDHSEHGPKVLEKVIQIEDEFGRVKEELGAEFDPELIFVVKTGSRIEEKTLNRSKLTLLSEEPGENVVLFSEDELRSLKQRIEEYSGNIPAGQAGPRQAWIASMEDEMRLWGPEDRRGRKLAELGIENEEVYLVDIELWSIGNESQLRERREQLAQFVEKESGQILDYFASENLNVVRVKAHGRLLENLLNVGIVQRIDLPPNPGIEKRTMLDLDIQALNLEIVPPNDQAPSICVIDSGISSAHPLLADSIGATTYFPESIGEGADNNGHGTFVAGIALYQKIENEIASGSFSPRFTIFSARVTNSENKFDDEKLIINQMSEAIKTIHSEYSCRIFNISLGDPESIYMGGKPSDWAFVLDSLSRELDIVIVVSAGNYQSVYGSVGDDGQRFFQSYPDYLMEEEARIIEPATSALSITVGSVIGSESSMFAHRHPNDPAYRQIGETGMVSPFSRTGFGVNGAIKPDVVEEGGNFIWNSRDRRFQRDIEKELLSTNYLPLENLLRTDSGTSFSAARVSHLAAEIMREYPEATANLVRAIIGLSTQYSDAVSFSKVLSSDDKKKILMQYGYGMPSTERALFSQDHRVSLFAQDEIGIDNIHLYEIPVPEEFVATSGRRRITISLAYDPPVRHTRKEYLGTKMEFDLFRGLTIQEVAKWHSQRSPEDDLEKFAPNRKCDTWPPKTRRSKGTLQKCVFEIAQNKTLANYPGNSLQLLVQCKAGWANKDHVSEQSYSLAIMIEHMAEEIQIYNEIRQQIQLRAQVRARA